MTNELLCFGFALHSSFGIGHLEIPFNRQSQNRQSSMETGSSDQGTPPAALSLRQAVEYVSFGLSESLF